SKAGILIKAGTRPGSAYAAMLVTGGHGVRMQYDFTQDTAGLRGAVSPRSPRWLRLIRSGGTLTGYDSADGRRWIEVGTARLGGLGGGMPLAETLTGAFAGLIVVALVAAMFVTAEYRRGLIAVTLAASPRRGQVLAAKAVVVGAVTFVAGAAGAAVAIPAGER